MQYPQKKKDHTGDIESMIWDKEALKREVEGYNDNHIFSYRKLAKRFNVRNKSGEVAKNGGQIVKEYLLSQNVNLARFPSKRKSENPVPRRKKRRGTGGECTMPTEMSSLELKEQLVEKLRTEEYSIGDMIVPKKVEDTKKLFLFLIF